MGGCSVESRGCWLGAESLESTFETGGPLESKLGLFEVWKGGDAEDGLRKGSLRRLSGRLFSRVSKFSVRLLLV